MNKPEHFLREMWSLSTSVQSGKFDFAVGDFGLGLDDAKHLIDAKYLIHTYGTYPLLSIWFPEVSARLRQKGLRRPRSEFFAASVPFLNRMLEMGKKKFAYEQTIAFLIYALCDKRDPPWNLTCVRLENSQTMKRAAVSEKQPTR